MQAPFGAEQVLRELHAVRGQVEGLEEAVASEVVKAVKDANREHDLSLKRKTEQPLRIFAKPAHEQGRHERRAVHPGTAELPVRPASAPAP